jgi:hypothetical protein
VKRKRLDIGAPPTRRARIRIAPIVRRADGSIATPPAPRVKRKRLDIGASGR